ncbi:MAG: peptide-methionine (R)-S-oxide reductase MsrB [Planctomycetota bacterium]
MVPIEKSPEQWKAELSDVEYHILREHGTERAFTGRYHDSKEDGVYACAATGLVLFDSRTKFDSGTGWPSFYAPIHEDHVTLHRDTKFGMVRTEVRCALCDGHLGHVFDDGPPPTGKRYCINGYALKFFDRATYEAALAAEDTAAEAG